MSIENTVAFPQTAEDVARHAANSVTRSIEWIAKAQRASIEQVKGDIKDGYFRDEEVVAIAAKAQSLGINVRRWSTYSADDNPLLDLAMTVMMIGRTRNSVRRIPRQSLQAASAG